METIKKIQKELYVDLKSIELEVQSLQDKIAEIKALGHPAQEQEQKVEKMIKQLEEARQRIEDLWRYAVPYGRA
jgi:uncharacterized protein involved in exopolysaccharide biosynthesis